MEESPSPKDGALRARPHVRGTVSLSSKGETRRTPPTRKGARRVSPYEERLLKESKVKINTDGASRGNSGLKALAVSLGTRKGTGSRAYRAECYYVRLSLFNWRARVRAELELNKSEPNTSFYRAKF
ncbi:hypothetical protein CRG98_001482 [Punica granatum]|uniref:Uncharacterized protein n=1 Tax=Punica granatum TaxID=22663 RepID=A0A2I0LBU3_PUNGR|nr:hypothetical protein CRG98_001482 [Punica granatum]